MQLKFDDITSPTPGKVVVTDELIRDAIAFGLASDKLIVCCRAGQSRSAAAAFSIAYEKLGKTVALSMLNPQRHSPNFQVLKIADGIIERPGILNAYDEWARENIGIRLTDFLDEIEAEYDELEQMAARDRISNCD